MKRSMIATSILILSGLVATPGIADPSNVVITFTCPPVNALGKFVNYVSGYGSETRNGTPSAFDPPFFIYRVPTDANIPSDLTTGSYANAGTTFDSDVGIVSCQYTSSASPAFDPITASYVFSHAQGSSVVNQTDNTINVTRYFR